MNYNANKNNEIKKLSACSLSVALSNPQNNCNRPTCIKFKDFLSFLLFFVLKLKLRRFRWKKLVILFLVKSFSQIDFFIFVLLLAAYVFSSTIWKNSFYPEKNSLRVFPDPKQLWKMLWTYKTLRQIYFLLHNFTS